MVHSRKLTHETDGSQNRNSDAAMGIFFKVSKSFREQAKVFNYFSLYQGSLKIKKLYSPSKKCVKSLLKKTLHSTMHTMYDILPRFSLAGGAIKSV
jgi:hypothetical protein